jgi:hypothetical protein
MMSHRKSLPPWHRSYSPFLTVSIKRYTSCKINRTGKQGTLKLIESYFLLMTVSLPKLQCYAEFVFCAITGKTRNRVNNFVKFYRQKRLKMVKGLN